MTHGYRTLPLCSCPKCGASVRQTNRELGCILPEHPPCSAKAAARPSILTILRMLHISHMRYVPASTLIVKLTHVACPREQPCRMSYFRSDIGWRRFTFGEIISDAQWENSERAVFSSAHRRQFFFERYCLHLGTRNVVRRDCVI